MSTVDVEDLGREFAGYALEQASPLVRTWRSRQFEQDLREVMAPVVAQILDDNAAQAYADVMRALAIASEHYKVKLLEIDGHRFLAQIDFADTTGTGSFVSIIRGSRLPGTFRDRGAIVAIAEQFSAFAPSQVRFFHPSHVPITLPEVRADQHLLAAPALEMSNRVQAPGYSRVTLSRPSDLAFYPRYVETYEQVLAMRPQLRGEVAIETQESLADCLTEDLLFEISVDQIWAGVIAARREMVAGLAGVFMVDILLGSHERGQGLGPAVHQHFARRVAQSDPEAVITGTIAPVNVPSLKTAQRAGRVEIGAWYLLDL